LDAAQVCEFLHWVDNVTVHHYRRRCRPAAKILDLRFAPGITIFQSPNSCLMQPLQGTSVNNYTNLTSPQTRGPGLHLCCWQWQYMQIFTYSHAVGSKSLSTQKPDIRSRNHNVTQTG